MHCTAGWRAPLCSLAASRRTWNSTASSGCIAEASWRRRGAVGTTIATRALASPQGAPGKPPALRIASGRRCWGRLSCVCDSRRACQQACPQLTALRHVPPPTRVQAPPLAWRQEPMSPASAGTQTCKRYACARVDTAATPALPHSITAQLLVEGTTSPACLNGLLPACPPAHLLCSTSRRRWVPTSCGKSQRRSPARPWPPACGSTRCAQRQRWVLSGAMRCPAAAAWHCPGLALPLLHATLHCV